ncbi:conserved hypothetical protein [Methanolacinia petrolearia DSM 11571]|uniref:Uncharacterized protein n=2 Tax=Methanolacinia TaxID=230355 RepID=E1RHW1_METP4|nr:conserved hypothetical protein [Methanolacinia petrolearia DSM 11571]
MKAKKGMRALSLLIVLALVGAMIVPVVSAEEQNESIEEPTNSQAIFEIVGYTNDFQNNVLSSSKTADSLAKEYGKLNIPSRIERYDIVQFDQVAMKTDQKNSLKVTIYDKEYTMTLGRMNFENIDDGIDSYSGSIEGLDDSVAIFTFDKNLVYGTIQLQDEIIYIKPVQNKEYAMKTAMPLHIVYSSKDVKQAEKPSRIDLDVTPLPNINLSGTYQPVENTESTSSAKSWAYVYVLVATDEEFDELESNWVSAAQSYMAQAAYQYERPDIGVYLNVVKYDSDSVKMASLSGDNRKYSDPLGLFFETFTPSYLDSENADIAIYLGGNDRSGGVQGAAWGYDNYANPNTRNYCRYAWSQMVGDSSDFTYDGSYHARVYCMIHEFGHIFNANHENSGGTNQAYFWYENHIGKWTVMRSLYIGNPQNTWEYSSPSYHGDTDCNNAGAINEVKGNIAGLA